MHLFLREFAFRLILREQMVHNYALTNILQNLGEENRNDIPVVVVQQKKRAKLDYILDGIRGNHDLCRQILTLECLKKAVLVGVQPVGQNRREQIHQVEDIDIHIRRHITVN